MPVFNFCKLNVFEQLEVFYSTDEQSYFPFHAHEHYCLSLIIKGTEVLQTENNTYVIPEACISITNADELHKNRSFGNSYSYQTVYIRKDIIHYINGGKKQIRFENIINDINLYNTFHYLIGNKITKEPAWTAALQYLLAYQKNEQQIKHCRFNNIDDMLSDFTAETLCTPAIAKRFCISPFHFIREFKKEKGITPQLYMLMKKLHHSKSLLQKNYGLLATAIQSGFYDDAHYVKTFKKYFGVTPNHYKTAMFYNPAGGKISNIDQ